MTETLEHWPFVLAAYAAAGVLAALLIGWILIDYRSQRARLAALEQRGIKRAAS